MRHSALDRSTTAAPGSAFPGRPGHEKGAVRRTRLQSDQEVDMNVVGVDVGATKIAAGVVSPAGEVLAEARYPTAHSREELLETLARAVLEVVDGYEVGGACLAVPGLVLARENRVAYSPNLRTIEGIRLKEELESRVGLSPTIENDNSAATWGEFRFGAGRGASHLVFVGLGTGIGGGVVSEGRLLRGAQGAGGELGHVTVHATGPRCACGNRGCLEALASGSAIGRRARAVAADHPGSALGRLTAEREVRGEDITELSRGGRGARHLGAGGGR
jgi:glucokinase